MAVLWHFSYIREVTVVNERQARYMLAIAEEGSVSKAAAKLFISQPSLSQLLLDTEKKYGLSLFKRCGSCMIPTFAGELFLEAMREITLVNRRLEQQISEVIKGRLGRIILGITPNRAQFLLPSVLTRFKQIQPNIQLDIAEGNTDDLLDQLKCLKVDMAVMNCLHRDPKLAYVELPKEEMILITSREHRFAKSHPPMGGERPAATLEDFANEPFIYMTKSHGVRGVTDGMFASLGIHPPKAFEIKSNYVALELVQKGYGVTIMGDHFLRFIHSSPQAAYFPIANPPFYRRAVIGYHPESLTQNMKHLIAIIQKEITELHEAVPQPYVTDSAMLRGCSG
jgi:DNA-binding transcriptional LysR family regulator